MIDIEGKTTMTSDRRKDRRIGLYKDYAAAYRVPINLGVA